MSKLLRKAGFRRHKERAHFPVRRLRRSERKVSIIMDLNQKLAEVSKRFCIDGEYLGYNTIQVGNVNQTYEVRFRMKDGNPKSFLIQNVNTYAFRHPVELMNNIDKVTEHIRRKKPGQLALHFHHTCDRKIYVVDGENFWRMTNFIPSVTHSSIMNRTVVRNAGEAFGEFQMQLADFDITQLYETIPDFHNTRKRYAQLEEAIAADPVDRVRSVLPEIEYLRSVREEACRLTDLQQAGRLPLRVTHNDTKVNNVLFNPDDDSALVVVDLDTVMPGLVGHDFGDAIRFAANMVPEDSKEYEKAGVDLEIFRAFAEGFLGKTARTLTPLEIDTLALSCLALTVELSTRFLADYILGDLYFNIKYPEHNLDRTRCQIALARDMQKHMPEMEQIVRDCISAN